MDSDKIAHEVFGAYSFGQNSYGELCHNDTVDRTLPTPISFCHNVKILDVACGNEQTAFLFETGDVFTCGYNDSGQCGIGSTSRVQSLRLVPALVTEDIAHIRSANGCEHLTAISRSGALYTFGFNSRGQLGHGSTNPITTPTKIKDLASYHVVEVACSYFHTIVMTMEGTLYAFGRNDLGQLGIDDGMDRHVPVPLTYFNSRPVLAVACGQHHTVVSLTNGGVVAFGKNDHGQLGTGYTLDYHASPSLLAAPLDSLVVPSLACGYYHTIALAEHGSVYSFGRNDYGQLGHGHRHHLSEPTLIKALAKTHAVQVTCGCYHTLVLSEDGKVYPFGRNNHGQLGLGNLIDCTSPQIIASLRDKFVVKVASGFYHSICLTATKNSVGSRMDTSHTLCQDLGKLVNNPMRSDLVFVLSGVQIHAHSCVVMARCEPLEKMLGGRMIEGSLSEINIPDYSPEVFQVFLEYLYTDEVASIQTTEPDAVFLLELLALADQYLVQRLCSMCERIILKRLSLENVVLVLQNAHFRNTPLLKKRCVEFVMDHFGQVIALELASGAL
uniref:RCC1 and BTB domaincontaining protein putative n=1 Tax=Albugo laibachii Nc14 TaxID=890382 RepID=F0W207_9STRA|nr:RCC1 and BTB domaincontaining protein putative [Albugo laibachii Nc14]|eukprot:CCA15086.1 RCC1 and BTB domaincontaining protein putative [Albugo laibachii Nc14]